MAFMPRIARVIVEIAVDREFDYLIPDRLESEIQVGSQVVIPFGRTEARGYVVSLSDQSDVDVSKLKEIRDRVGKKVLVEQNILDLARWIADYYCAPVEAAVRTVLPGAVRKKGAGFKERLMVFPTDAATNELAVEELRRHAPKQAAALDVLLSGKNMFLHHLARAAGTTTGTIRTLEEKGFVQIQRGAVRRDPTANLTILPTQPLELMTQQADALKQIKESIDTLKPPVLLLYGVTGSGKTEVYLQAIQYAMDKGRGAIVLVPEISLTPQTLERFHGRFGDCVAVLHSSLGEGERHDEWHRVHEGKARIVIGARSALFAPVKNLGLIVVDEEHEPSYKQEESPRYNARDVAVMRGHMEKCSVVLGTATPALESYCNALSGKYGIARLPHRVDHRNMPVMRIVDMRIEAEREGHVNVFSRELIQAIQQRLDRAEQSMLFLNRRGYATSLICPKCGFVAQCDLCSVAMTYHRQTDELICHICGARRKVPKQCPNPECRDPAFRFAGFGTQRVELALAKIFPRAHVQRMDSDTTTRKDSHHRILGDFRTGKIDILVGTQMITKGLHFPNVTLVGVLMADLSLHMPDFRAAERTFQLLTQVAGRAGRGDVKGEVIVQTYTPFHPAIQAARRLDFEGFCDQEIEFRRELSYPPYTHLVCVTLKGPVEERVSFSGAAFVKALQPELSKPVVLAGPAPAPLARAKGFYRYQVILRAPTTKLITAPLKKALKDFKWPDGVTCAIDVDAVSLM
jgi:primosomal protein N' (replication factor Y) (superfamily II helicase)